MVRGSILPVKVLPLLMLEFLITLHLESLTAAQCICIFSLCATAICLSWPIKFIRDFAFWPLSLSSSCFNCWLVLPSVPLFLSMSLCSSLKFRRTSMRLRFVSFLCLSLSMSSCFGFAVLAMNLTCLIGLRFSSARILFLLLALLWHFPLATAVDHRCCPPSPHDAREI